MEVDPGVIKERITARVEAMVSNGFLDEVKELAEQYGWEAPGMSAPGYKAFKGYVEGQQSLDEAKAQFVLNDLHLAKRQRSWFRRNKYIHWVSTPVEAEQETEQFLENQPKT